LLTKLILVIWLKKIEGKDLDKAIMEMKPENRSCQSGLHFNIGGKDGPDDLWSLWA